MNIYLANRQDNFSEVRKAFSEHLEANNDPDVQYMFLMSNDEVVCVEGMPRDASMSWLRGTVEAVQIKPDADPGAWTEFVGKWDNGWEHYRGEISNSVTVHYLRG